MGWSSPAAVCSDITASWQGGMSISSRVTESCCVLVFAVGVKAKESRWFSHEGDEGVIVAAVPLTLRVSALGSRAQVTQTPCLSEQESDKGTVKSKLHIPAEEEIKVQIVKEVCVVSQLVSDSK